ncbi:MAG: hypothetical protein N2505_02335 [Endomicrobia bacterium]|nr:hypothetical protein [Endomicrobiia bacterium]
MKSFTIINKLSNFLTSIMILTMLLGIYDVILLRSWLEKRFLEKFTIVIVLKDNAEPENIIESIKKNCNSLKFKKITFLDKNQIYEKVTENIEMKALLSVIKSNPFSDVIKIEFLNYFDKEIKKILNLNTIFTEIKEVIFDYNIKSYLDRLQNIKMLFNKIMILLSIIMILIIILRLTLLGNNKISWIWFLFFSIIYFISVILNIKFINNFISYGLIKVDTFGLIVHIFFYIFCISQLFSKELYKEENVIDKEEL